MFLATVTNRSLSTPKVTTLLGPFTTERDACQAVISHLMEPYTDSRGDMSCVLDYTLVCEYLNETDETISDEDVEAMFDKCSTEKELMQLFKNSCSSGYKEEHLYRGWDFKIHSFPPQ